MIGKLRHWAREHPERIVLGAILLVGLTNLLIGLGLALDWWGGVGA